MSANTHVRGLDRNLLQRLLHQLGVPQGQALNTAMAAFLDRPDAEGPGGRVAVITARASLASWLQARPHGPRPLVDLDRILAEDREERR